MDTITYIKASEQFAESYCSAVDTVAKERKYLASVDGFPLDSTIGFVKMIEANNLAQFYAIENDQVIGWCDILPKSFEGLRHVGVLGMGVLGNYRGQGIGRTLLEMTLDHAKNINGLEKVELEVFESNLPAIKLYAHLGFKIEGVREKSRKLDGRYDNIVLMGKYL